MPGVRLAEVIPFPERGPAAHSMTVRLRGGKIAVGCSCPAGELDRRARWADGEARRIWREHLAGVARRPA